MDNITETYKGVEIFETMRSFTGSHGLPAHLFKANINGKEISARGQRREYALSTIKNKIDNLLS